MSLIYDFYSNANHNKMDLLLDVVLYWLMVMVVVVVVVMMMVLMFGSHHHYNCDYYCNYDRKQWEGLVLW